jgi:prevent-host-death family protein
MQVNVLEAKNQLSQLIRRVQAGDEVIIANRGLPVARLVPAQPPAPVSSGADFVRWLVEHPLLPHARRSADEIDAAIEAERRAWD